MSTPFAINRAVRGKPSDIDAAMSQSSTGWENRITKDDRSLLDAYALKMGCAFTMCSLQSDWRMASNIKEIGGIGLDFDEGMTWQEAKADSVLGSAWLCYPSPSFTPDKPWKFRLIWRFEKPTTDQEYVRQLLLKCLDVWPADAKCKDPARLWFGNPGATELFSNDGAGFVPTKAIDAAWDAWALLNPTGGHLRHQIEKANRIPSAGTAHEYCPVIDGHYRDDIAVAKQLMKIVPPWGGRGSMTFDNADPVLAGMACWFGVDRALTLMLDAGWIWHDSRGEMEEVVVARHESFNSDNPFGVWSWMLDQLVLHGAISSNQRGDFLRFKPRGQRG